MTAIQIIDETVKFYSEDPSRRAVVPSKWAKNRCEYLTNDGRQCAVGRCLLKSANKNLEGSFKNMRSAGGNFVRNKEILFKKKYRGFSEDFWSDLQNLHDLEDYWGKYGITKKGLNFVKELKEDYKNEKNS